MTFAKSALGATAKAKSTAAETLLLLLIPFRWRRVSIVRDLQE